MFVSAKYTKERIQKMANETQTAQKMKFSVVLQADMYKNLINNTLQDPDRVRRFVAAISSAVAVNPALQECDPRTVLNSALLGESLNLSPSPQLGLYYMIPFDLKAKVDKNTGEVIEPARTVATFVLGWRGYAQLAMRSGQYKNLNVCAVKKGEFVSYDPFREIVTLKPIADPLEREVAETIGYYAFFEYLNGFRKELYWPKEKMIQHAERYSKAVAPQKASKRFPGRVSLREYLKGNYDSNSEWVYSSFWHKDFDVMASKTMLRRLISKWGIMSIEMQTAYEKDNTTIFANGMTEYVENDDIKTLAGDVKDALDDAIIIDESTGEIIDGELPHEAAEAESGNGELLPPAENPDGGKPPQLRMDDI